MGAPSSGASTAAWSPAVRSAPRILVVGAGAIGGVVTAGLLDGGHDVTVLTTNARILSALAEHGIRLSGKAKVAHVRTPDVCEALAPGTAAFDYVLLATQPPQVDEAARAAAPFLSERGRLVCFQNGLCEERVARTVGRDRVIGAVVAWGASMIEPGCYERTSHGGFTVGRLEGPEDAAARECATLLSTTGPVKTTDNLRGARWSKLAINCAVSTLGTIGGDRVGALMRLTFVRRLVLDIMTETVRVARAEGVRLEKVAGTVDLDWLALTDPRRAEESAGLVARHVVLTLAGLKYRRLRSSMLAAIERGRPPAVDFLNGEVVEHGERLGIGTPVNRAARDCVWRIARGEERSSVETLWRLYEGTRAG